MHTISRLLAPSRSLGACLTAAALLATAACSRDDAPRAGDSDLQRDLQLATTSVDLAQSPVTHLDSLETAPRSAPAPAPRVRAKPGPKAVRSHAPTVAAAPEPTPAESVEETQTVAEAPAQPAESEREPATEGVALPRPSSIPVSLPSGGRGADPTPRDGGSSGGTVGGGIGAVIGPIFGVVIRGGGVDGDHCEIHDRRGRGRPVYGGNPGGIGAGSRGPVWGRGRMPVNY